MLEQAEIQGSQFPEGDGWDVGGDWDPHLNKKGRREGPGHPEGLTWGFALFWEGRTGEQSRGTPRGGTSRAAQTHAGGSYSRRLAACAVGEVQLPCTSALHVTGPRTPSRQASAAGHTC